MGSIIFLGEKSPSALMQARIEYMLYASINQKTTNIQVVFKVFKQNQMSLFWRPSVNSIFAPPHSTQIR